MLATTLTIKCSRFTNRNLAGTTSSDTTAGLYIGGPYIYRRISLDHAHADTQAMSVWSYDSQSSVNSDKICYPRAAQ